jgi:hypothetical protein
VADTDGYRSTCAALQARFAGTTDPNAASEVAWICALSSEGACDWGPCVRLAELAVEKGNETKQIDLLTLGAVLYRAGRYEEAKQRLAALVAASNNGSYSSKISPAFAGFFLAMAQEALGEPEEASHCLARALAWQEAGLSNWKLRLTWELLRDEARKEPGMRRRSDGG